MDWNWSGGAPADVDRDLRVFALPPNWKDGILESLAWSTDIMSSEIGTEQRRSIRRFPRRMFEMNYMRAGMQRSRVDTLFAAVGRKPFLIPLWHEAYTLEEATLSGGVVFPEGTLAIREFRVGNLVLVTNGDANKYDILTVTDRSADTIALNGIDAVGPWKKGTRIVPLRRAMFAEFPQMSNVTDRAATVTVRVVLMDTDEEFIESWGYCAPLWRFKPDRQETIDTSFMRSDFLLDFDAGVIEVTDPGERSQVVTAMKLKFFGREKLHAFRSFLYMARGRAVRFYTPSFEQDLMPMGDMNGPTFDARKSGFSEYMDMPQEARRIIAVTFKDTRPPVYRTITAVQPVLDSVAPYRQIGERFTVDQDMPPILERDVDAIMFVMPSRFDSDTIEIVHAVAGSFAASTAVTMRSSVVDGMPPIDCWVSSRPYPLDALDSIASNMSITGGGFRTPPVDVEQFMANMLSLTGGTLRSALNGFEGPIESLATDMLDIEGGTLRVAFHSIEGPVETLKTNMLGLTGGTIRSALISYMLPPTDLLKSSLTITQGTLE